MKTYFPKEGEIKQSWYVVDAQGEVLGRLAARLAAILRGKTKPTYTPYADTGDFVVVVNAEKVLLTGNKIDKKRYYRHSKHPGGLKVTTARTMLDKKPEAVVMLAVRGMLPKNSLGRKMLKKLKVYKGKDHPHKAQMPVELNIKEAYSA